MGEIPALAVSSIRFGSSSRRRACRVRVAASDRRSRLGDVPLRVVLVQTLRLSHKSDTVSASVLGLSTSHDLVCSGDETSPEYSARWEADDGRLIGRGPCWAEVDSAIVLARARADIVLVPLGETGEAIYSAGVSDAEPEPNDDFE
jgi:hypothetical protein